MKERRETVSVCVQERERQKEEKMKGVKKVR